MNRFFVTCILLFLQSNLFSQNVQVLLEKKEYKLDEEIIVTVVTDFHSDSVSYPSFDEFKYDIGPSISSSTEIKYGKVEQIEVRKFSIYPTKSGVYKIESPVFYLNGKTIIGKNKEITILDDFCNENDKRKLSLKKFYELQPKPDGTLRYILNDEFGYIEKKINNHWTFVRYLSQEEFQLIHNIK